VEQNIIALVIPCFNEATRNSQVYWNEIVGLKTLNFIFVDDGSSDATYDQLLKLKEKNKNVIILRNKNNQGKAASIRNGIIFAFDSLPNLKHIGYLDADGAFSVSEVQRIFDIAIVNSADCIWSSRVLLSGRDLQRNAYRHYLGRVVRTLLSLKYSRLPYDTQAGFKVMRINDSFTDIWKLEFKSRWFLDLEMLLRWRKAQPVLNIWEEPVQYWHEIAGSKITLKEFFRVTIELLRILTKYREGRF